MKCASSVEDSTFGVPEVTRCETGEGDSGLSSHRADVGDGEVICSGGEDQACGRREEGELVKPCRLH